MPGDFVPVLVLMIVAGVIAVAIPVLSSLLGRNRPNATKGEPFECGVAELDSMKKRTSIRYYMVALLFIIFDIEIAFLYPWAVVLRRFDSRVFVFTEMVVFLGVLGLAYAWVWKKGALEWD